MCIVHICPDNMRMTCTYVDNSSKYQMYITYASVDNIQMTLTMCVCRQCADTKLRIIGYMWSVRNDKQMMCTYAHNMRMT